MGWTRLENVKFPTIWHKFKAKDVDNDNLVEYRVQDMPEDRFEDTVEFLLQNFLDDEPFTSSKNLRENPDALEEITEFWRNHLKEKSTLVCFRENSDEIVGLNLNAVSLRSKKDDKVELKTQKMQELIGGFFHILSQINFYENFQVDSYLTAYGLSVSRKYRGRGIAAELLRARIPFCQAFDIKITGTIFTSTFAQKSAAKVGFKEHFAITQEELVEANPAFFYKNFTADKCRFMIMNIPEKHET